MFDVSPIQIIMVLAIALVVFGPKRLPELGRNLGAGIRDFKDGLSGESHRDGNAHVQSALADAHTVAGTPED